MGETKNRRKACPLLVQSDTNPSLTIAGQSWTRTFFLECLGPKCIAWDGLTHECHRFGACVDVVEEVEEVEYGQLHERGQI